MSLVAVDGACAPLEGDLLDYKREFGRDDVGIAELCRDIVAMHNTYGGYLVLGVAQDAHERFEVVGGCEAVDVELLKNKVRDYTDERILVTQSHCSITTRTRETSSIYVLHIPPRQGEDEPVRFVKDGPGKGSKGRPVFLRGDIVFRSADETRSARGAEVMEIWRPKPHPQLLQGKSASPAPLSRIHHNLPDRVLICPRVVGRKSALDHLWQWLPDDLSRVKVLAGEGGIGKSSIAYEFADQVTLLVAGAQPFSQVIWLSAKERQFRPFRNAFDDMVETHFGSYEELLECLCDHLAVLESDRSGGSTSKKLKLIKQALAHFPSLIVIDDVDSLPEGEQKQALEIGFALAGTSAKILLTTRKNVSYSADICYTVRGLDRDEFRPFFQALMSRFPSPARRTIKDSDVDRIWECAGGSPLFAESILRLLSHSSVSEAIQRWKGESGDDVRRAALQREIEQLLPESRRVLLSLALLSEASFAELAEVSGYPAEKVGLAVQHLSSLFLVDAPRVGSEERIRVSDTTSRLVISLRENLATDHARLERLIRELRAAAKGDGATTGNKSVAVAIMQALALERQGKAAEAIETLKYAARKLPKEKRGDLLAYMGHLHLKTNPAGYDAARSACREAYQLGCKKKRLFESWFNSEWEAGNYPGAEEAARAGVQNRVEPSFEWRIRLAAALQAKAHAQSGGRLSVSVLPSYLEASEELSAALKQTPLDEAYKWRSSLEDTNDVVFATLKEGATSQTDAVTAATQVISLIERGDIRVRNYVRTLDMLQLARRKASDKSGLGDGWHDALRRIEALINERNSRFPDDDRHAALFVQLGDLNHGRR
jgi:hypothetical protein